MSGYSAILYGSAPGDHTGEVLFYSWQKTDGMFQEVFGQATNSTKSATLTAASTDDYDPWGANPPQDFRLYVNPTTNNVIITSLARGRDGLRGQIINVGTGGFLITCPVEAGTGTAANKFYGSGTGAGAVQGGSIRLVYNLLPNPRWYTG